MRLAGPVISSKRHDVLQRILLSSLCSLRLRGPSSSSRASSCFFLAVVAWEVGAPGFVEGVCAAAGAGGSGITAGTCATAISTAALTADATGGADGAHTG